MSALCLSAVRGSLGVSTLSGTAPTRCRGLAPCSGILDYGLSGQISDGTATEGWPGTAHVKRWSVGRIFNLSARSPHRRQNHRRLSNEIVTPRHLGMPCGNPRWGSAARSWPDAPAACGKPQYVAVGTNEQPAAAADVTGLRHSAYGGAARPPPAEPFGPRPPGAGDRSGAQRLHAALAENGLARLSRKAAG